ncbi:MAG TPA: hypothetical protein VGP92_05640 [Acidimicrobiia bacterium]|nr:hypothetical protein [Acidimicrobiia bacterium]
MTRPTTPQQQSNGLRQLIPGATTLGFGWEDDGDPGTSLDLTRPPSACSPFLAVFDTRTGTALHEFSFLVSSDGQYERGHMNVVALRAKSAAAVSSELAAVAQPSFQACAEATAIRRFYEIEDGSILGVSSRLVYLAVGGANVLWRATITSQAPNGASRTMEMDVGYLGAGDRLVKVRVATCGCNPPVAAGELLPGELPALQSIALGLSRA